jgi:dipeptidyl aminopeptidase/acylaminoacyl peptidase
MNGVTARERDIRRPLVAEDLAHFRWLDELALSPRGDRLAYTVRSVDLSGNGYRVRAYLRDLTSGEVEALSPNAGQAGNLVWSREGATLAFTHAHEGTHSVHLVDEGGRSEIALGAAGMSQLTFSGDGTLLAGVRWIRKRDPRDVGPRPGIPAPTIKVMRRLRYKLDGIGWVHDRYAQIVVLDLRTGDVSAVTDSECDFSEPAWSETGHRLAFIGMAREQDVALGQGQIFVADLGAPGTGPRRLLPDWVGACRSPQWGDGDTKVAFAGHEHPAPTNRRVFLHPYVADVAAGSARPLVPGLDQEVGNYAASDSRKGLANVTVKWAPGDPWIYFLLTEQGASNLHRVRLEGAHERIVAGESVTFEYSPAAGDVAAFGQADPGSPGELYLWRAGQVERLTDLNPWLRDRHLATPEEYWYDGLEGAKVHGWLMRPVGLDESKQHPAIVYVHCSMFSWDFSHEFQCLVGAGHVLTYFNQRGTTAGYGQAWTRASEGDQGGKDYKETMIGVERFAALPYVDGDRLGITGGSCGGFMTNWVIGHTNRFRAAVTQRSITNFISFAGTSDFGPEYDQGELATTIWDDVAAVWRQSPLAYADRVETPLLIVHSDEDFRCALEQAEQLFAALRWMGKEVEMVVFEGENHGLSRGGRPGNRIERLRRIGGWFERHLGTRPMPTRDTETAA